MSRADLARRSGLSPAFVSQLVSGDAKGRNVDTQKRIAQAFEMAHEQLVAAVRGQSPPSRSLSATVAAIKSDPDLTENQKRILLENYYELRRRR